MRLPRRVCGNSPGSVYYSGLKVDCFANYFCQPCFLIRLGLNIFYDERVCFRRFLDTHFFNVTVFPPNFGICSPNCHISLASVFLNAVTLLNHSLGSIKVYNGHVSVAVQSRVHPQPPHTHTHAHSVYCALNKAPCTSSTRPSSSC